MNFMLNKRKSKKRLGLRPRPHWESYQRSPRPPCCRNTTTYGYVSPHLVCTYIPQVTRRLFGCTGNGLRQLRMRVAIPVSYRKFCPPGHFFLGMAVPRTIFPRYHCPPGQWFLGKNVRGDICTYIGERNYPPFLLDTNDPPNIPRGNASLCFASIER